MILTYFRQMRLPVRETNGQLKWYRIKFYLDPSINWTNIKTQASIAKSAGTIIEPPGH
jgi:hypothetical protein